MPRRQFVIFFSAVLSVYALINFYIFVRGWRVLPDDPWVRGSFLAGFLLLALSFLAGRFLERIRISWLSTTLVWIGSIWLGAMVYFLLFLLVIDVVRLVNFLLPFHPAFLLAHPRESGQVLALIVTGCVILIVVAGFINARAPKVTTLALTIPKHNGSLRSLNIVAASDIHLGTIIRKARLQHIVERINALAPDVVLLPGDVFDEDIGPVIKQNLGETLRGIRAPLGVYAITGNHEYIGGVEEACRYLTDHGIIVLRDRLVRLDGNIQIAGREDRSVRGFTGKPRASLETLLKESDPHSPLILMDHQPFHLEESVQAGVDLQISGHTHHGQLWPFNFITRKVYEVSRGHVVKGNTHFYVSSGLGTWGPPVRTVSRPEILNIRLTFA